MPKLVRPRKVLLLVGLDWTRPRWLMTPVIVRVDAQLTAPVHVVVPPMLALPVVERAPFTVAPVVVNACSVLVPLGASVVQVNAPVFVVPSVLVPDTERPL